LADDAVVGCTGVLLVGTRGAEGPEEARVRVRGGVERYLAWSDDPLPKGAGVLVIEARGPRTVGVVAWPDPLVDSEEGIQGDG
jgi:hypothetical protein